MIGMFDYSTLNLAKINKKPFPYVHVSQLFADPKMALRLARSFPRLAKGGSYSVAAVDCEQHIKQLITELEGEKFRQWLESKFSMDLSNSSVVTTFRGFSRMTDGKIHRDSKTKILTVLLYMNEEWPYKEGRLRLLNSADDINDYAIETPAEVGSLLVFEVTGEDWHGYLPIEKPRCSIQLNYCHGQAGVVHKLRHGLSAFTKKITSLI